MLRRSFIAFLASLAFGARRASPAKAAEAAQLPAESPEALRMRLDQRLARGGFLVIGETRRKGDFVIVTASRRNIAWRLVVDGRTGDIIGQRPLATMLTVDDQ